MSKLFYQNKNGRHVLSFTTVERKYAYKMFSRGYKVKKTKGKPSIPPTVRALEHFDVYYKPSFKQLWPSMRLALLTARNSSAVINSYADSMRFEEKFIEAGAIDIVESARLIQGNMDYTIGNVEDNLKNFPVQTRISEKDDLSSVNDSFDSGVTESSALNPDALQKNADSGDTIVEIDRKDLDAFIPVKKLISDSQSQLIEEVTQTVYSPLDMRMDIVKPDRLALPERLKVYCFPAGDISRFPNPKVDKLDGFLCFFIMDAASILPVIALDLQEGDNVLDLCAAPGGKSLCILQTGLAGSLTCNDISKSRLNRLRNIMNYHIPEESREHVKIEKGDGINFEGEFDKVLVDVPCNTDRHVLLDDFNNLYSPARTGERLGLPEVEKNLLVSAIKCCRRGGSVVYSTCTLAATQNDGIIQQAFDEIVRTTDIGIVIEDISEISQIFRDTFRFYNGCRLGQLVIPSITANFGPMYICRIKRIQ